MIQTFGAGVGFNKTIKHFRLQINKIGKVLE